MIACTDDRWDKCSNHQIRNFIDDVRRALDDRQAPDWKPLRPRRPKSSICDQAVIEGRDFCLFQDESVEQLNEWLRGAQAALDARGASAASTVNQ